MSGPHDLTRLALHGLSVRSPAIRQYCPLAVIVRLVMSRLPFVECCNCASSVNWVLQVNACIAICCRVV